MSLSLNLTPGWKPRNQLVVSVADWLEFRGQSLGRTVCSRPRSLTVSRHPLLFAVWSSSFDARPHSVQVSLFFSA